MLSGNDISSFQGVIDWDTYKNNSNFALVQVSEGVGFTDPQFARNQTGARRVDIARGWYHLCYPQLNQPQSEASYFLKTLNTIRQGELLILDFEEGAAQPVTWAKTWLDYVSNQLGGYKPLIYIDVNHMNIYDWTPIVEAGYGLWLADYSTGDPATTVPLKYWTNIAFHQWTNGQVVPGIPSKVDGDSFFGDEAAFLAYGYKTPVVPPIPTDYQGFSLAVKGIVNGNGFSWSKVAAIKTLITKMGI